MRYYNASVNATRKRTHCDVCGRVIYTSAAVPRSRCRKCCVAEETVMTKAMHQVPGLTMLECGCRATQQEPYDGHPLRLIYVEHCPLHASAPDLLAALDEIIRIRLEVHENQDDAVDVARAAIHKAKGL